MSYWSELAIGGRIHTRTHIYTLSLFLLFVYFFVCVLSLTAKGLVIIRFRWTTVDQDYNNKQQVENQTIVYFSFDKKKMEQADRDKILQNIEKLVQYTEYNELMQQCIERKLLFDVMREAIEVNSNASISMEKWY